MGKRKRRESEAEVKARSGQVKATLNLARDFAMIAYSYQQSWGARSAFICSKEQQLCSGND
jgi:hypothetical protein